jgi:hypothetical protein
MWHDPNATWGSDRWGPNLLLGIELDLYLGPSNDTGFNFTQEASILYTGTIEVANQSSNWSSGSYQESMCLLRPAVIDYNVSFDSSGHVALLPDSLHTGRVLSLSKTTSTIGRKVHTLPDTMDLVMYMIMPMVASNATAAFQRKEDSTSSWSLEV